MKTQKKYGFPYISANIFIGGYYMEEKKKYYTQASAKASVKYQKANYDRISLSVPKATKELWKQEADKQNKSLRAFILDTINEKIKRS